MENNVNDQVNLNDELISFSASLQQLHKEGYTLMACVFVKIGTPDGATVPSQFLMRLAGDPETAHHMATEMLKMATDSITTGIGTAEIKDSPFTPSIN